MLSSPAEAAWHTNPSPVPWTAALVLGGVAMVVVVTVVEGGWPKSRTMLAGPVVLVWYLEAIWRSVWVWTGRVQPRRGNRLGKTLGIVHVP